MTTDETVPLIVPDVLNPRYSYGGGKIISELLAINYGRKHFERVTIFRPHNDETYWGAAESGGATGRLIYSKALIVVAAEQDGKGIGRIRMARIPRFQSGNASRFYPIVGRTQKQSLHRWAQLASEMSQ